MLDGGSCQALRPREERLRTILPARMRSQSEWSDACILNISPGGLLVYSAGNAQPGTHVEIRRGGTLIIANVVWRKNQRIGLCSHHPVPMREMMQNDTVAAIAASDTPVLLERRRQPRSADTSRLQVRAMDFAATAAIGIALAAAAALCVEDAVSRPVSAVEAALAGR